MTKLSSHRYRILNAKNFFLEKTYNISVLPDADYKTIVFPHK